MCVRARSEGLPVCRSCCWTLHLIYKVWFNPDDIQGWKLSQFKLRPGIILITLSSSKPSLHTYTTPANCNKPIYDRELYHYPCCAVTCMNLSHNYALGYQTCDKLWRSIAVMHAGMYVYPTLVVPNHNTSQLTIHLTSPLSDCKHRSHTQLL